MGIKQLYNDNLRKLPNEYGMSPLSQQSRAYRGRYPNIKV